MDINDLSKSQIVLLTFFTSFVTSIVTGIVTFSLVSQTPPSVAQTVNRVIEHTIEKVTAPAQTALAVVAPKTVIVKESDLIPQAVEKASASIVRLYSVEVDGAEANSIFLGLGVVLSQKGGIVADLNSVNDTMGVIAILHDGTRVHTSVIARNQAQALAYLTPSSAGATSTRKWIPITLNPQARLGETVIVVGGKSASRIDDGIVTLLSDVSGALIDTNIPPSAIVSGSPIIAVDGTLLGISTSVSRAGAGGGFIATSVIEYPKETNLPEGAL